MDFPKESLYLLNNTKSILLSACSIGTPGEKIDKSTNRKIIPRFAMKRILEQVQNLSISIHQISY
jgi:hypothetical protein